MLSFVLCALHTQTKQRGHTISPNLLFYIFVVCWGKNWKPACTNFFLAKNKKLCKDKPNAPKKKKTKKQNSTNKNILFLLICLKGVVKTIFHFVLPIAHHKTRTEKKKKKKKKKNCTVETKKQKKQNDIPCLCLLSLCLL